MNNIQNKVKRTHYFPIGRSLMNLLRTCNTSTKSVKILERELGLFGGTEDDQWDFLQRCIINPSQIDNIVEEICEKAKTQSSRMQFLAVKPKTTLGDIRRVITEDLARAAEPRLNDHYLPVAAPALLDGEHELICRYVTKCTSVTAELVESELECENEIRLSINEGKLLIASTAPGKEMTAVNQRIIHTMIKDVRAAGISQGEAEHITFTSFTNQKRAEFFLKCTAALFEGEEPGDIISIDIVQNKDIPLPENKESAWLLEEANQITLKADKLKKAIPLIKEQYYDHFLIKAIEVTFKLKNNPAINQFTVKIAFKSKGTQIPENDASLEYSVSRTKYKRNPVQKNAQKGNISRNLDNAISKYFNLYKEKDVQVAPPSA